MDFEIICINKSVNIYNEGNTNKQLFSYFNKWVRMYKLKKQIMHRGSSLTGNDNSVWPSD